MRVAVAFGTPPGHALRLAALSHLVNNQDAHPPMSQSHTCRAGHVRMGNVNMSDCVMYRTTGVCEHVIHTQARRIRRSGDTGQQEENGSRWRSALTSESNYALR
jgi:hypothetical protein